MVRDAAVRQHDAVPCDRAALSCHDLADEPRRGNAERAGHVAVRHHPPGRDGVDELEDRVGATRVRTAGPTAGLASQLGPDRSPRARVTPLIVMARGRTPPAYSSAPTPAIYGASP